MSCVKHDFHIEHKYQYIIYDHLYSFPLKNTSVTAHYVYNCVIDFVHANIIVFFFFRLFTSVDWPYWCGRWRWIRVSSSGLTSRYSNWDKREPGGGTIENCVGLQTKGRKWHDYLCTNKFSYVCKKPAKHFVWGQTD